MGWFSGGSGILGSIVSAAQGIYNTLAQKKENSNNRRFSRDMMDKQQTLNKDYAEWSAKELPKMNREGMEAAGFNPLLAINEGTGVQGNVSPVSATGLAATMDLSGVGRGLSDIADRQLRSQAIENLKKLQSAQIKGIDSTSAKNNADAALAKAQAKLVDAQTDFTKVQSDMYGMNTPLGVVSRVVVPVAKTLGPRAWDAINRAGNAIGDKVVNSAKSVWHSLSSRPAGDVPGDPTSGMSPAQKSEYLKAGPHNRPHAPYKSYKVHGHW